MADTVLRVHGSAGWTGSSPESGTDRMVEITNCGPNRLFLNRVSVGQDLTGSVSPTRFHARLDAGSGPVNVFVPKGQDLVAVSSAAGTWVVSSSFVEVE